MQATKIINMELSKQEECEVLMLQLLESVKLGLISKVEAIVLFREHLENTFGYKIYPKEYPYLKLIE